MIDQQFSQWLDKRCDHRLWACGRLLDTHARYAATDAYIMRLDEAARAQGPTRLVRPAAAEDDSSEDEAKSSESDIVFDSSDDDKKKPAKKKASAKDARAS